MPNTLGKLGEQMARTFLEEKGYIFLKSNYIQPEGEIDLIMKDKNQVVFVEVKTRNVTNTTTPNTTLSSEKLERIEAAASYYIEDHQLEDWRYELVAITVFGQQAKVQLIQL